LTAGLKEKNPENYKQSYKIDYVLVPNAFSEHLQRSSALFVGT